MISSFPAAVLVGAVVGFMIGRKYSVADASRGYSSKNANKASNPEKESPVSVSNDEDSESETELLDMLKGNSSLAALALAEGQTKMVLVVRTDLGMTKGKIAAQCAHAALACYKIASAVDPDLVRIWENAGQAKITLQAQTEETLELLQAQAMSLGLCARVIHDAGRTQIASGSATVLGIGPGPVSVINEVTGSLKLF
ncbi:Aminoacyl-tRNA hydrolase [Schizosaccharomyces pombe]